MTQVLADIYADPPHSIANHQDESLTWLGDERHVPAVAHREPEPATDRDR